MEVESQQKWGERRANGPAPDTTTQEVVMHKQAYAAVGQVIASDQRGGDDA